MRFLLALTALICISPGAVAGVVLTWETTVGGQKAVTKMYFDNGDVRVESLVPEAPPRVAVFHGGVETLWVIRREQGTYTEVTVAAAKELWQRTLLLTKLIKDQSGAPQESQSMRQPDGQQSEPKTGGAFVPEVLRELGTTSNFGDWTCRNYEQVVREKKLADICLVPFESLHLTVSDISSYRSMADLMLYFAGDPATNVLSHSGVPIRATSYVGGRAMIESTLVASKEMALDRSLFQQPTDLRKIEVMPTASQGR